MNTTNNTNGTQKEVEKNIKKELEKNAPQELSPEKKEEWVKSKMELFTLGGIQAIAQYLQNSPEYQEQTPHIQSHEQKNAFAGLMRKQIQYSQAVAKNSESQEPQGYEPPPNLPKQIGSQFAKNPDIADEIAKRRLAPLLGGVKGGIFQRARGGAIASVSAFIATASALGVGVALFS